MRLWGVVIEDLESHACLVCPAQQKLLPIPSICSSRYKMINNTSMIRQYWWTGFKWWCLSPGLLPAADNVCFCLSLSLLPPSLPFALFLPSCDETDGVGWLVGWLVEPTWWWFHYQPTTQTEPIFPRAANFIISPIVTSYTTDCWLVMFIIRLVLAPTRMILSHSFLIVLSVVWWQNNCCPSLLLCVCLCCSAVCMCVGFVLSIYTE